MAPRKIKYYPKPLSEEDIRRFANMPKPIVLNPYAINPLIFEDPKRTTQKKNLAAALKELNAKNAQKQRKVAVLNEFRGLQWANLPDEIPLELFKRARLPNYELLNPANRIIVSAKFRADRVNEVDEEKRNNYLHQPPEFADLIFHGRGNRDYNEQTITRPLENKKMVKPFIEKVFQQIEYNPYMANVRLLKNSFMTVPIGNAVPPQQQLIRQTNLQREGLIDPSANNEQGYCCIDLFVQHMAGLKQKHTGKIYDRAYILCLFKSINENYSAGYTIDDICTVAERLGCPSITVYLGHHLYRSSAFNNPLVDKQFKSAHNLKVRPLVVVVVDGHVYISPLALSRGVGRASQKPGLMDYMTALTGKFCVVDKFMDVVPDDVKFVYIRGQNTINEYFRQKLDERILIKTVDICEKTMNVTKVEFEGRIWCYQPDIDKCIKILADTKVKYTGQSFHFLLKQYARRKVGLYESILSPTVYNMFRSQYAKGYGSMGWMPAADKKKWKSYQYADVRKCYQSCLLRYFHAIHHIGHEFQPYDGHEILPYHIYFVVAPGRTKCLLMNGPGVYIGPVVQRALDDGIIKYTDIKLQLIGNPSKVSFMQLIYEINEALGENDNLSFNKMVGLFSSSVARYENQLLFSQSWEEIMNVYADSTLCNIQKLNFQLGTAETMGDGIEHAAGNTPEGELLFINSYKQSPKLDNFLIAHHMIINLMHLVIYESVKAIADANNRSVVDCVAGFYVDCVAFYPDVKLPEDVVLQSKADARPGQLVKSKPFTKANCMTNIIENREFEAGDSADYLSCLHPIFNQTREITYIDQLDTNQSAAICSLGGYGKSFHTGLFVNKLLQEKKNIICCAWTHTAVESMNKFIGVDIGQTVCSVLGIGFGGEKEDKPATREDKPEQDNKTMTAKINKNTQWLIIDEYSLIPSYAWALIYKYWKRYNFKVLIAGDQFQIISIDNEGNIPILSTNSIISEMVGGRYLRLTKNYRAETDPAFANWLELVAKGQMNGCDAVFEPDYSEFPTALCDLNIVATNSLKNRINDALAKKYYKLNGCQDGNWRCFPGLPIICVSNNNTAFKNGQNFIVESVSPAGIVITRNNWKGEKITHTVGQDEYKKNFEISYAITADKSQGRTFSCNYAIWELDHHLFQRWGAKYVAFSRSSHSKFVHLGSMQDLIELESMNAALLQPSHTQHSYIYGLKINGRVVYVGQTNNIDRRINEHKTGAGCKEVYEIIKCQGEACFDYEILWSGPADLADAQENNYIEVYKYNLFNSVGVANQL